VLTVVMIKRIRGLLGEEGVEALLETAGSGRTLEYLENVGNWIDYDEAIALWDAGEAITHDPEFARHVGEDTPKLLAGSATASVIRSLGSLENHFRQIEVSSKRYSKSSHLEAIDVRPGYAHLRAFAVDGLPRSLQHCAWTRGLFAAATELFGVGRAKVEHSACQALGAADCQYVLTWDSGGASAGEAEQNAMLRAQLDALSERLDGVFATAADLISAGELEETLARIADRAAQQVRAPRYMLAVKTAPSASVLHYQKGLDDAEAGVLASQVLEAKTSPDSWCVAEIRSQHRDYGRLVAMGDEGMEFLAQERAMLELYGRYAATALDSATALHESQRRHEEARALLELARHIAAAGTSEEIAERLVETVPLVIDCDRVSVWIWDEEAGENVRRAVNATGHGDEAAGTTRSHPRELEQLRNWLEQPDPEPFFLDMTTSVLKDLLLEIGLIAAVAVPIATRRRFLGSVMVYVRDRPERLADTPELRERLAGVAAHAVSALESGRLVDHVTHQARHDQLTGLANRLSFNERLGVAAERARGRNPFALLYIDLDRFKPVNDEFGHGVGDALLQAVAKRLSKSARPEDTVARLGGDEFAIIVEGIDDESQVAQLCERFAQAFSSPFVIDGHRLLMQASIGQAVWPADAADVEGLIRAADLTMYTVKRSKPGRAVAVEAASKPPQTAGRDRT
jgi:diguanylate cyclase (GGDEF)-like protein